MSTAMISRMVRFSRINDAAFTFRDDDDVDLVRMIEDEVAGSRTSKKVTYPRFRLPRIETSNQSFAVLASAKVCER